jgi:hypothetical protein
MLFFAREIPPIFAAYRGWMLRCGNDIVCRIAFDFVSRSAIVQSHLAATFVTRSFQMPLAL